MENQKNNSGEFGTPVASMVPIGTVMMYAGLKDEEWLTKQGWLICDGRSLKQDQYPDLFSAIRGGFGQTGDTFNIPDCRGMFVRGVDDGRGKDPNAKERTAQTTGGNTGDKVGSVQGDDFKSHNHWVGYLHYRSFKGSDDSDKPIKDSGGTDYYSKETGGKETRPVNTYLYYIIKFKNVAI